MGQLVGQMAMHLGLRVIGSAGSSKKVDFLLKDLQFDAAFNYKKGSILENLQKAVQKVLIFTLRMLAVRLSKPLWRS